MSSHHITCSHDENIVFVFSPFYIYIYGLVFKFWVILNAETKIIVYSFFDDNFALNFFFIFYSYLSLNKISYNNNDDNVASDKNHEHSIFNQKTKTKQQQQIGANIILY